jgi:hypothetical protein
MSGRTNRNQGTSRGRGGRRITRPTSAGRGYSQKDKATKRKSLEDYVYYIGSAKQASDFVTITKYLINEIAQTFEYGNDIAQSLEARTKLDIDTYMPELKISTSNDDTTKEREDKQFKMLYEAKIRSHVERDIAYNQNLSKAYAFLFKQCNKALQAKIQARADFEVIKHDPFKLLLAIEEYSMSYQENKYEVITIADAIKNLFNLKQRDDESLIDYTGRFKSAKGILITC